MSYDVIKIVHALAAVAATGPLLFAPWLSARLVRCQAENKTLLLSGLAASDRFYNIAGWALMLSGIALFWLQDWHRVFQLWFILSVVIFIVDSAAEKRWRDPANEVLAQLQPGEPGWAENTARLHKAVIAQMICTSLILVIMLLHSQLQINVLNLAPWAHGLG
ncbi:MAG: hypothetical protein WCD24_24515 [Serratia inhibens]|uniref:DUF2269 family protein n=1 Tax=Serratia inhibens TaxID=2338073 RepID=UPI003C7BF792